MRQTQVASEKAHEYTFGVEIECYLPDSSIRSHHIRVGSYHNGIQLPHPFPTGWTAEKDSSLSTTRQNYQSVEIVSPILRGREGIEQMKQVANLLVELGAVVNQRCGFHVHVGAASVTGNIYPEVAEWAGRLLYQTAMHETALYASTGSRRRETGAYARSVKLQKEAADKVRQASDQRKREVLRDAVYGLARFHTLNLSNLFNSKQTAEFRAFAGTTSWVKMVGHVCTCLALAERATEAARMDWDGVASQQTYRNDGQGLRELNRFLYLTGWNLGRREVGMPEVHLAGWVASLEDLPEVKRELRRLAKKYDKEG